MLASQRISDLFGVIEQSANGGASLEYAFGGKIGNYQRHSKHFTGKHIPIPKNVLLLSVNVSKTDNFTHPIWL